MNRFIAAGILLLLCETSAWAQASFRVYTQPDVPRRETLARLDLVLGWRTFVPMDGRHDGMYTIQVTQPDGRQILVQTRSGGIFALDAESGAVQWRARQPTLYANALPLGYNSKFVFAVTGANLSAFDRRTGALAFEVMTPGGCSAAPVADDERAYLTMANGRIATYLLPRPGTVAPPPPPTPPVLSTDRKIINPGQALGPDEPAPTLGMTSGELRRLIFGDPFSRGGTMFGSGKVHFTKLWEYSAESRIEMTPLLTPGLLLLGGYTGTMYALNKFDGNALYRFAAGPPLTAQLGQYDLIAYIASQDYTVYGLDILPGRTLWRFAGGGPILAKPAVDDDNVYVTPEGVGLYRLGRERGETIWRKTNAERFLSSNKRFVYATDRLGHLLVLDRETGNQLGMLQEAQAFVVPITNEFTDRIYMASNDGLIISMHDRVNVKPLVMKKPPAPPAPGTVRKMTEEEVDF
jgi:outer membrane protein assembly factor BamB